VPSPSRIFDRCAAPSASLTASLWHGNGRWERQARSLPQADAAQPSTTKVENQDNSGAISCHIRATRDLGSFRGRGRAASLTCL
jgi:hypothetical protein